MSEPFLGEIRMVGFNYAPRGWMFCAGQQMSISQNSALFALLGTTYGGNGQTTFALPDMRGRGPVGMGPGPGLTPVVQGEVAGSEHVNILTTQMPIHTVQMPAQAVAISTTGAVAIPASSVTATVASPVGAVPAAPANSGRPFPVYNSAQNATDTLKPFDVTLNGNANIPAATSAPVGGSQPLPVRNPYLGTNFIIAVEGIFPSRN
ncbi:MAG: tail fiber protein [Pseudomonas sp.]|uniref:phage tail protein n=1 Tax=Pseudomonas sp. TaxID=306 RepID=UPI00339B4360